MAQERNLALHKNWSREYVQLMIPNRPGEREDYRHFHGNVFPERVEPLVYAAEERYAWLLHHAKAVPDQLSRDVDVFLGALPVHLAASPRRWPKRQSYLAVYQGAASTAEFYGFLLALKSLLDILGSAWALTADPSASVRGFHKGKIDGELLAGGGLANWLRRSCPEPFPSADAAARTIVAHSREWITDAVKCRDAVVHHGGIPGATPMAVVIDNESVQVDEFGPGPRRVYTKEEVIQPGLPNGTTTAEYCSQTLLNVRAFLSAMVPLFAYKKSRVAPGPPVPGDRFYVIDVLPPGKGPLKTGDWEPKGRHIGGDAPVADGE